VSARPDPRTAVLRRAVDGALAAGFVLALAAPTLDEFLRPPEARGPLQAELREPAPRPVLYADVDAINRFPAEYEAWYADTFGLRDQLLRWGSALKLFGLGVSPTPVVEMGRDGWMYYTDNASAENFRGLIPLRPAEVEAWELMLANHRDVCTTLGIEHLYVVGPNKETIYPERAPPQWTRLGPTRFEQLSAWLAREGASSGARILDLRPALLAEKEHDTPGDHVYYPYGTHWNGRGCYVAYRAVLEALQPRFPGIAPLEFEQFSKHTRTGNGDSWGRAMYIDDLLPQYNLVLGGQILPSVERMERGVRVWTATGPDPTAPSALLYHDSFGQSIMGFLAPHFSKLVCYWTGEVDDAVIEREEPDIVIELFVERLFVSYTPQEHLLGRGDLSRLCFDRSTRNLLTVTRGNAADFLVGRGGARVEAPVADGLARIVLQDVLAYLALAPFNLGTEGDLLLRFELDSSVETEMLVMPVWKGETEPRRRQTASAHVEAGANTLYLRLPRSKKLAGLAWRPGLDPGEYLLRSLEVRGMPGE
jgi:hypothetical protein